MNLVAELDAAQGPVVRAAGVVCWRLRNGSAKAGLEVLIVHQAKYREWSWPKGKVEDGETLPACAVRETLEETGLVVRLGRSLPTLTYPLITGERKEVYFWTARVVETKRRKASATEIDDQRWVSLDEAEHILSHPTASALVAHLRVLVASRELDTNPVLVLRHATARPRDAWPRSDAERPLIDTGRLQAKNLVELLACWRPSMILTSPWRRCGDTLQPYTAGHPVKVRTKGGLAEDEYRRDPRKASKHLEALLNGTEPAMVCTHRPVLAGLTQALAPWCAGGPHGPIAALLPTADPYLAPAELLIAHVARRADGRPRVVALERHAAQR